MGFPILELPRCAWVAGQIRGRADGQLPHAHLSNSGECHDTPTALRAAFHEDPVMTMNIILFIAS